MYTLKQMKFPIFITLDEDGLDPRAGQMYKIKIQDCELEQTSISTSNLKELLQQSNSVLTALLADKTDIPLELSKEELIKKHLELLDKAYHETINNALQIVNNLLQGAYEKSFFPIGNSYILSITPSMEYILKDWLHLWEQPKGTYYDIVGNKVFILISAEIPSIIEGDLELYLEKVLEEEIFEHEYYRDENLSNYKLVQLGYKKIKERQYGMLFLPSGYLFKIEEQLPDNINFKYYVEIFYKNKVYKSKYINTLVDLHYLYNELELMKTI